MGSGVSGFSSIDEASLRERPEQALATAEARAELAALFQELLAEFNDRPTSSHRERLGALADACEVSNSDRVELLFGGSVAKHTYVDGLSDVDCLFLIDQTSLASASPRQILDTMRQRILSAGLDILDATTGAVAVTVTYKDGMTIQLVPALRANGIVRVPGWGADRWSEINPASFARGLTTANERCGKKLIPCIKLVKAIVQGLPADLRPNGYHIESLAIEAFKRYDGSLQFAEMLPRFFARASGLVLEPIRDKTGQSRHVDEYLGPAHSDARRAMSHLFEGLERRMTNALKASAIEAWRDFFDY